MLLKKVFILTLLVSIGFMPERAFSAEMKGLDAMETNEIEDTLSSPDRRAELFRRAESGDSMAQFVLAIANLNGYGIPKDIRSGIKWLELSANAGFSDAQVLLGSKYLKGDGIEKNYKKALELFSLAEKSGNSVAAYNLGLMFSAGLGVAVDLVKAYQWYSISARLGNPVAQEALKGLHQDPQSINQDETR